MEFNESDLKKIAEDIRTRIIGGKAVTLEDYVNIVSSKKGDELGLFNLWVAKQNAELGKYFPKEVFEILKAKVGRHHYSDADRAFIRENARNGTRYIALNLNISPDCVHKQAQLMGVTISRIVGELYSDQESTLLKSVGLDHTDADLTKLLVGRTKSSIQGKRLREGIKKRDMHYWEHNPEKVDYIIQYHGKKAVKEIASDLNLSHIKVEKKIHSLISDGKLKPTLYTWEDHPEKDAYLIEQYGKLSHQQIADDLDLTYDQVNNRLSRLRKAGKVGRIFRWVDYPEKETYLLNEYGKLSIREIAHNLNLKYRQVENKILQLRDKCILAK